MSRHPVTRRDRRDVGYQVSTHLESRSHADQRHRSYLASAVNYQREAYPALKLFFRNVLKLI